MNKLLKGLVLLVLLATTSVSQAFRETGGGSVVEDDLLARFATYEEFFANNKSMIIDHALSNAKRNASWSNNRFGLLSQAIKIKDRSKIRIIPLVDGNSWLAVATASYYYQTFYVVALGDTKTLYVNLLRYASEKNDPNFDMIVFHEFLRLVAVDDTNYVVSRSIYPIFEKYILEKNVNEYGSDILLLNNIGR